MLLQSCRAAEIVACAAVVGKAWVGVRGKEDAEAYQFLMRRFSTVPKVSCSWKTVLLIV